MEDQRDPSLVLKHSDQDHTLDFVVPWCEGIKGDSFWNVMKTRGFMLTTFASPPKQPSPKYQAPNPTGPYLDRQKAVLR